MSFQQAKEDNAKGEDVRMTETFEVLKFQIPPKVVPAVCIQMGVLENRRMRPTYGIDPMLIDEELLYLDEKEADLVYQELKSK
jgi:hypothetical protein